MITSKSFSGSKASDALEIGTREIVALVGGGGKTSLMYTLAHELQRKAPVLTSTSTKIAFPSSDQSPELIMSRGNPGWEAMVRRGLRRWGHVTLVHFSYGEGKLKGPEGEIMESILARNLAPYVVIEADGARQRPLKAPREDEPLIPRKATLVVGMIGWDCLGKPLDDRHVYRASLFHDILGMKAASTPVTEEILKRWICHPEGLQKKVPPGARFTLFLNKCDNECSLERASTLIRDIQAGQAPCCLRGVAGSLHRSVFRTFWAS